MKCVAGSRPKRVYSPSQVWYNEGMGGSKRKNPLRPSYEEGELRDKGIEKMQDPSFQPDDLKRLVAKTVKKAPGGAST